jgi:Asp-tRNA(Asn)/Glu-tRNA(Gln) amidotransferase B subunit
MVHVYNLTPGNGSGNPGVRAKGATLIDLNRAGSTLIEVVTAPDLRSAEAGSALPGYMDHTSCDQLDRVLTAN